MKRTTFSVKKILNEFVKLPRFADGTIDYSNSTKAPVVVCFVQYKEKILLLKRSKEVRTYQGKWNTVAGYIDEPTPLRLKILEELQEEIGVQEKDIGTLILGQPFSFQDKKIGKTWIVHPALAILQKKPSIVLDWEHTKYTWIYPQELQKYDIVPNAQQSLRRVLNEF